MVVHAYLLLSSPSSRVCPPLPSPFTSHDGGTVDFGASRSAPARPRLAIVHSYLFIKTTFRLSPQWPVGFLPRKRSTESVSSQIQRCACFASGKLAEWTPSNYTNFKGKGTRRSWEAQVIGDFVCCWYLAGVNTVTQLHFTSLYTKNLVFTLLRAVPGILDIWL